MARERAKVVRKSVVSDGLRDALVWSPGFRIHRVCLDLKYKKSRNYSCCRPCLLWRSEPCSPACGTDLDLGSPKIPNRISGDGNNPGNRIVRSGARRLHSRACAPLTGTATLSDQKWLTLTHTPSTRKCLALTLISPQKASPRVS